MPQREVKVAIIGDPSSLQRALGQADRGVNSFGQRMQAVGQRLRSVGSTMTRSLTLPLVAFGAVAYRELSESQRVLGQTEAVIRSMGIASTVSVGQVQRLTNELRDLSGMDDEGIQEMINTLLTFRNAVPIIDEASRVTLDLATFFGGDLQQAANQVGRALNNPLRGITALTRRGVEFTEEQRRAVEQMVAFGNTAGAQQIILRELNAEFGGQAGAFGETVAGRFGRLRQVFEDMAASILEDLLPVLEDLAGHLSSLTDAYSRLSPGQQQFVAGLVGLSLVAGPLTSVIGLLAQGLGGLAAALGVSAGVVGVVILLLAGIAASLYIIITRWDQVKLTAQNALANIVNNTPGARAAIGALGWVIGAARDAVVGLIEVVVQLGRLTLDGILAAFRAVLALIRACIDMVYQFLEAVGSGAAAVAGLIPGVGESSVLLNPTSQTTQTITPASITPTVIEESFRRALRDEMQQVLVVNAT